MRCEEKVPGGKLVCIEISATDGRVTAVTITGDFFLHPEDRIAALEESLLGMQLSEDEGSVADVIGNALAGAQLIGATPEDLARIFKKAVS